VGSVDNWPLTGPNSINDFFNLGSVSQPEVPAGYIIKISLQNDVNANVSGATYLVIDTNGNTVANKALALTSIPGVQTGKLAPIIAFELNVVGPVNSESATLSSGAGTITYTSADPLSVLSSTPACAESGYVSAELANSFYGTMAAGPSGAFTQSFNTSTALPMIRKPGKPRPHTIREIRGSLAGGSRKP
jgi:hypothetical protein